ncbi:uncharacterized protein LOC141601524 [Silene latifolia]|uniref:uncharacterized protein LOC141601524 n=1 Tax=Silene latifolia TaxID=37657 RepID=UPI003D77D8F7
MHTFKNGYNNDIWIGQGQAYTVSGGLQWLSDAKPAVLWFYVAWNKSNIPKHSFIYWLRSHNRLLTKHRLKRIGIIHDEVCYLCGVDDETHTHLFYECQYSRKYITLLQQFLRVNFRLELLHHWTKNNRGISRMQRQLVGACHVGVVYAIWEARNHTKHNDSILMPRVQVKEVVRMVKQRFWSMNEYSLSDKELHWLATIKSQNM